MISAYDFQIIFQIIILLLFFAFLFFIIEKEEKNTSKYGNKVSEISFQRYSKFLGKTVLHDENFHKKINKIYELITKNKETDKISELSNCDYNECILKIKYLKHKDMLKDYYIDTVEGVVKPCDKKDKALIKKYIPYIYYNHYQIDEIVRRLPYSSIDKIEEIEEQVLNELDYLDKKNLIHGLNIDRVDKKIIYYVIEKQKKEKDYISINCESCGALNDIPRRGKVRCEYCKRILEDESMKK